MASSFPQLPLTSCCFQKIPAVLSLYWCHWSCSSTNGRGSRCHDYCCRGFHCPVIRFHSRWSHCSSSPRPPWGAVGSGRSCDAWAARQEGPDHCCRCPLRGGLNQAHFGCSHPSGAVVPWRCTLRPPLAWSCMRLLSGPPEPRSDRAWRLNLPTSGGVLSWACSGLVVIE